MVLLTWGSSYSVTTFLACSRSAAASFLMTRKSLSFGYSVLGWGPRSEKEFVNLKSAKTGISSLGNFILFYEQVILL